MLLPALIFAAAAQPVRLDLHHPPTPAGTRDGRPVYTFGPNATWPVQPAVVLSLDPGQTPPPGAVALGGPFWRITAADPVGAALSYTAQGWRAFPDVILPVAPRGDFDDPSYGGQWYLESIEADLLFERSMGDPSVRVAVIDSGIDIAHTDLKDAVDGAYDALDDDDDPSPNPGEYCSGLGGDEICDTHGTSVSGIVAARANNGAGIVGLCPACTLVPIRMLGEDDGGLGASIRAFEHAIAEDVAVINNSWGYTEPTTAPAMLAEAVHRAATEPRGGQGALVIFAAGNDDRELGTDEIEALDDVLCVSAIDSYGRWTNYTNYGAPVDLAAYSATVTIAPGDAVTTTFGGTSAAAPVASGVAGWAASVAPDLSAPELAELLIAASVQSPMVTPDEDGHHDYFGYGILDGEALITALYGEDSGAAPDKRRACACATSRAPSALAWICGALALSRRRSRPRAAGS